MCVLYAHLGEALCLYFDGWMMVFVKTQRARDSVTAYKQVRGGRSDGLIAPGENTAKQAHGR